MVALLTWLETYPPLDFDTLSPVNHQELRQPDDAEIIELSSSQFNELLISNYNEKYLPHCISIISSLKVAMEASEYQHEHHDWSQQSTGPQHYDGEYLDSFEHDNALMQSDSSALRIENYLEYPALGDLSIYHTTSEPILSMSEQMTRPVPRLHLQSHSHSHLHPSPAPRRSRGYGKLTFVDKPDQFNQRTQWTAQELHDNRRIIAFHKETTANGDAIQLACYPITSAEYDKNMLTISCVYFAPSPPEELQHNLAGQCVFTSVDIIVLMERVTNFAFNVQEKNRIRRNLEGFRPQTIKKEGTTFRFFNQLMGYTQPKTRNIEKDIKVFLWSDITKALKKIVQKYRPNGDVQLGTRMPPPPQQQQTFNPTVAPSQTSSSESLLAQPSFAEYSQQMDYSQPPPSPFSPHWGLHVNPPPTPLFSSNEESGDSSNTSISPQSHTSQLMVPTAEYARNAEQQNDAGNYVAGVVDQTFEGYEGMSGGDFLL
jgi:hypothetical protein